MNTLLSSPSATFDLRELPLWIRHRIPDLTFLGSGVSSTVWDFHNGYVLKISPCIQILRWNRHLFYHPHPGFASNFAVFSSMVSCLDNSKPYHALIQPFYRPLRSHHRLWHRIQSSMQEAMIDRFEPDGAPAQFSRFQGYNCYGVEAIHHLQSWRRTCCQHSDPLIRSITSRIDFLIPFFRHYRDTGIHLDVDHPDNWARDHAGSLILLDPLA